MDKEKVDVELSESKKKNKKLILIIALVVVILLASGGVFAYSMMTDTPLEEMIAWFQPEKPDETMVLDEFLVNAISTYGKTDQVLRINIAITHINDEETGMVRSSEPVIRDIILGSLKDLKVEKLMEENTIDDFKKAVKKNINDHFEEDVITGIYVTDLIVR